MRPRTVGVEEELFLVDPETRAVSARSRWILHDLAQGDRASASDELDREFFQHQLETRTPPLLNLSEVRTNIVAQRARAAEAAGRAGVLTMASGTSPLPLPAAAEVTREDRYLGMVETFGEIARPGGTCGMHVHVQVDSDEEGVAVIDHLVPWLPVVLAVSANSPYHGGHDTHYASWRSQLWAQWPSAGPTEAFRSVERYREVGRWLVSSGAARDEGMLYFDARVSRDHPTVEVRIGDVCTDPDTAVLIAALVRGLVMHAAHEYAERRDDEERTAAGREPTFVWRSEMLRAAQWRAARYGLSDKLLNPATGEPAVARDVLDQLQRTIRDQLDACGDTELVSDGVGQALAGGGAARQRAALERTGDLTAVIDDLVARTNGEATA